ncbi:MAG: hypothetical protein HQL06_03520 [Nitrospirae bacterium]|nr:hypothetical protein [Nitrospirota bacterium]
MPSLRPTHKGTSPIAGATELNYRYIEETIRHALEVDNIRGACKHAAVLRKYFDRMVLYRQGRVIVEKVAFRVSDAVIYKARASKDWMVGSFLHGYARSLCKLGEARQAIAFHEKVIAVYLEVYGERHPLSSMMYCIPFKCATSS